MNAIAFLIPGDLSLPTGGYGYDRNVLKRMPAQGAPTFHIALPGAFPNPSAQDLEDCLAIIRTLPQDCVLLIDGLAYGAMPEAVLRQFGRPFIALCHHPLALEHGLSPERASALFATEKRALELADAVVVTSPLTARILTHEFAIPAAKITIAEPGTERKKRATGSGQATLSLLAVGSVVPRKGYDVLIDALAGLTEFDWHLTIAGAHREPETLKALEVQIALAGLGERVSLPGSLKEAALDAAFEQADLFVMSSHFEGYGMVLAESLQRGLPIVTTTGGAASETVPEGAGLKVPSGDSDALAAALARALADPLLRAKLGHAAFAAGEKLPRWEDTAARIAQVTRAYFPQRKAS